jgi:hypothetical protein
MAAHGWHVLPLAPTTKRPLGNCPRCRETRGRPLHPIEECPCLPAGGWCHGVRAATTNPTRLTTWWTRTPAAIPAIAAGPSGLVLIDIDHHTETLPPNLATGLLPGIDLTRQPIPETAWNAPDAIRDGHDTLRLLAQLRGGHTAWPADPAHQPIVATTPSGGHHLWYQTPAHNLHQVLADPQGRYGLAWQVDIKAGWSYGIAPGAHTAKGTYHHTTGDIAKPGRLPPWLAHEITRAAGPPTPRPTPPPTRTATGNRGANYLNTVINRGTDQLKTLKDGRKLALSALAYQAGGLLAWSGLNETDITEDLIAAGIASGLPHRTAERTVTRALNNGKQRPLNDPRLAVGGPAWPATNF